MTTQPPDREVEHGQREEAYHEELHPGWSRARPEHIPRATYWPAAVALGLTFFLWGFLTTWIISVIGVLVMGGGIAGWIGEWRHDH